jgi:two-component system phosphate regulon sensor histidine kinase PhoR
VASAVEACRASAEQAGVALKIEVEENLRTRFDASILSQAVINLIDNAVKHSGSAQGVLVSGLRLPEGVAIRVSDRGVGIPREHLPRLFERFYRVDKGRSRDRGGTGLGLAIVKHIAQTHGGSVTVESTVGKGSVFTILIP